MSLTYIFANTLLSLGISMWHTNYFVQTLVCQYKQIGTRSYPSIRRNQVISLYRKLEMSIDYVCKLWFHINCYIETNYTSYLVVFVICKACANNCVNRNQTTRNPLPFPWHWTVPDVLKYNILNCQHGRGAILWYSQLRRHIDLDFVVTRNYYFTETLVRLEIINVCHSKSILL